MAKIEVVAHAGERGSAGVSDQTPTSPHMPPTPLCGPVVSCVSGGNLTQRKRSQRLPREFLGKWALCGEPFGSRGCLIYAICEMGMGAAFQLEWSPSPQPLEQMWGLLWLHLPSQETAGRTRTL